MSFENPSFGPEEIEEAKPSQKIEKKGPSLQTIEEKTKIIKEIENPSQKINAYLKVLKEAGKLEDQEEKIKVINEVYGEILESLEKSDPELWKEKRVIEGTTILENKKLKVYENLVDVLLENEVFLVKQKENESPTFLFDEIFSHWSKELSIESLNDLTSKDKQKQKIAQFRAKEVFNFHKKALETNAILVTSLKKDWQKIEDQEILNIETEDKVDLLFNFTEKWLDKENVLEKDDKEFQKALKELKIEFPKKEDIYENTIKISYLNGIEFDNLKGYLEKFLSSNVRDRVKIDLVEFLDLSEKGKQEKIKELVSDYHIFPEEKISKILTVEKAEEIQEEGLEKGDVGNLIIEFLKQNPEIKTLLENPQVLEILRKNIDNAVKEINALLEKSAEKTPTPPEGGGGKETPPPEQKEAIKKAVAETKKGLLKPGFYLLGYSILALLILGFLLETKLAENISKSLSGGKKR